MNAQVVKDAKPSTSSKTLFQPAQPTVILIDGVRWTSPVTENPGEAMSFNLDAARIVERLNAK